MLQNIYAISDIELGQGDIFDDFKDEKLLIDFLNTIRDNPGNNLLILNGDTFDFLKMPYQDVFTHHITEEISLWKLERIMETYPNVFAALTNFLTNPTNKLHFNIGNHDHDLHWPRLQALLRETIGHSSQISFAVSFETPDILIEHGNQVDYFYKCDTIQPFLTHKGQQLLNLPFGYMVVSKYFIELKRHFPLEERLYPRHQVFESFPEFRKLKHKIAFNFVVKELMLNFIFSLGDPVSSVPYLNLVKHVLQHGLETDDDSKFMYKRFKHLAKSHPGKKAYIIGHLHLTHHGIDQKKEQIYIVTDTWREEVDVTHGRQRVIKPKNYAHVIYDNDVLKKVDLITFP